MKFATERTGIKPLLMTAAGVICCVCSIVLSTKTSNGQGGTILNYPGFSCAPTDNPCPACTTGANFGCATPIPFRWFPGVCWYDGYTCDEWTNYNCGVALNCNNGTPIGNCPNNATFCR